jgi:L,D-transpeptidase catalytic domain
VVLTARTLVWIAGGLLIVAVASVALRTGDKAPPVSSKPKAVIAKPQPDITSKYRDDRLFLSTQDKRTVTLANGEQRIVSSLLNITSPMRYGSFVWNEGGVPPGSVWVRIDLEGQTMSVFRGEHEIGTGIILFGADSHPTPRGRFPVMAKYKDHQSSLYDAKMPYTLRLTGDGVSIHGSNVRRGLATHGCIGIPTAFAARIFGVIKVADPVYILAVAQ